MRAGRNSAPVRKLARVSPADSRRQPGSACLVHRHAGAGFARQPGHAGGLAAGGQPGGMAQGASILALAAGSSPVTTRLAMRPAQRFGAMQAADAGLRLQAQLLTAAVSRETDQVAAGAIAALVLATAVRRAERPGWELLATDVHGLPWTGSKTAASSHEAWAKHQACGPSPSCTPAASTVRPAGRPKGHEPTWPAATIRICSIL